MENQDSSPSPLLLIPSCAVAGVHCGLNLSFAHLTLYVDSKHPGARVLSFGQT